MKNIIDKISFIVLFLFSILYIIIFFIAKKTICPYSLKIKADNRKYYPLKNLSFSNYMPENFFIKSSGYQLNCLYYDFGFDKTVIICHGWTANMYNYIEYVPLFFKLKFNVMLYDQRYHGDSGGNCITFGYFEKLDLKNVVNYIETTKKIRHIGLFGKSMGAATVIQYLPNSTNISFAIVDCPYSDLYKIFNCVIKSVCPFLPSKFIIFIADVFFRIKGQFKTKHINPLNDIKKINIPMLMIHGANDCFVPTIMSQELYNAKKDKKHLLIISDASHGNASQTGPKLYNRTIEEFLSSYGIIQ
ncbi:hypothetical protein EDC19_2154 [Natranaerovirga hydrolytica]|uniref:AB hydrolase-1 domain-containing protein n=1 Tax=Natranaerovirga hydrolytica TaxID=680378 RepID=A0A4R1MPK8_9FIRM|nr:alpha/beta hydrolase [Natranaerovirga hydrolytica]TCK92419.1 hypothetical protein EDC19_2154 [Natranaerovirga hydrolytica]